MSFKIKYKIIYQDVIKKVEIQYIKKEDKGQLEKNQQGKSLT